MNHCCMQIEPKLNGSAEAEAYAEGPVNARIQSMPAVRDARVKKEVRLDLVG